MKTYLFALLVLCVVLLMHMIGLRGLYVHFPPYDIILHILGGIGIGLAVSAFIKIHGRNIVHKRLAVIIGVLIIGLIWELFEVYYDIAGYPLWTTPYFIDTAKDLLDDIIGGSLAAWIAIRPLITNK